MTPYTPENFESDKGRILEALDEITAIHRKYADVIAIPEIVTLHDVTDYRVETERGIVKIQEICDRNAAINILQAVCRANYITQEKFEDVIVSALQNTRTN
jgi:hypothetical protein